MAELRVNPARSQQFDCDLVVRGPAGELLEHRQNGNLVPRSSFWLRKLARAEVVEVVAKTIVSTQTNNNGAKE